MDKEIIKRDAQDEAIFLFENKITDWYPEELDRKVYTENFAKQLMELIKNGTDKQESK